MTDRQPIIDRITKIMGDYKLDRKDAPKHLVKKLYDKTLLDSLDVQKKEKQKGVPYYDIDVTATAEMFLGQERETTDTYIMIPLLWRSPRRWHKPGTYYPRTRSPSRYNLQILVKNKEVILWGEAYLVITDELRTIKKLKNSKEGEQYVDLEPADPNFQTTTIKRSDVVRLYIIKGKLKRML